MVWVKLIIHVASGQTAKWCNVNAKSCDWCRTLNTVHVYMNTEEFENRIYIRIRKMNLIAGNAPCVDRCPGNVRLAVIRASETWRWTEDPLAECCSVIILGKHKRTNRTPPLAWHTSEIHKTFSELFLKTKTVAWHNVKSSKRHKWVIQNAARYTATWSIDSFVRYRWMRKSFSTMLTALQY